MQLISTVLMLDYVLFLLKEEKLLLAGVRVGRGSAVLIWPFWEDGPCRSVSLTEPQADFCGESVGGC